MTTQPSSSQTAPTTPAPQVSLWPREHGAYAEMAFPQLAALAVGGVTPGALLFTTSVLCAFLVHEPALVWMGRRGRRLRRGAGPWAPALTVLLLGMGVGAGLGAVFLSPSPARIAAGAAVVPGVLVAGLVTVRREKTVLGELLVALAFATASLPTALAAGVPGDRAGVAAAVWAVVFGQGTMAVQATIERFKTGRRGSTIFLVSLSAAATAIGLWTALRGGGIGAALAGVIPTSILCLLVTALGLTPRKLRWLGWSMVTANVVTLVWLVVVLG